MRGPLLLLAPLLLQLAAGPLHACINDRRTGEEEERLRGTYALSDGDAAALRTVPGAGWLVAGTVLLAALGAWGLRRASGRRPPRHRRLPGRAPRRSLGPRSSCPVPFPAPCPARPCSPD